MYSQKILQRCKQDDNGCLVWHGAKNPAGYGKIGITISRGKRITRDVHRIIYEESHGELQPGIFVCHHCDNPACCNIAHMFSGTQKDNLDDMRAKRRESRGKSHADAIREGWTPELRQYRAEQTRKRMQEKREEAARQAGVPSDWKYCPDCETWYPRDCFYKNKARHDGLKPICKDCAIIQTQRLRQRRKERI